MKIGWVVYTVKSRNFIFNKCLITDVMTIENTLNTLYMNHGFKLQKIFFWVYKLWFSVSFTGKWGNTYTIVGVKRTKQKKISFLFSLVEISPGNVRLFATTRTIAHQAHLCMGIFQARILEWVAMPTSRGSSQPRDWTSVSWISGGFFTIWATMALLKNHL